MDEAKAREILANVIGEGGGLTGTLDASHDQSGFVFWLPGDTEALLDGKFTPAQLDTIAWWVRQHSQS